jgi:hypothetical protein
MEGVDDHEEEDSQANGGELQINWQEAAEPTKALAQKSSDKTDQIL